MRQQNRSVWQRLADYLWNGQPDERRKVANDLGKNHNYRKLLAEEEGKNCTCVKDEVQ